MCLLSASKLALASWKTFDNVFEEAELTNSYTVSATRPRTWIIPKPTIPAYTAAYSKRALVE
jgi:hypothetical protein